MPLKDTYVFELGNGDVDDTLHTLGNTKVLHGFCRLLRECFVDLESKSRLVLRHLEIVFYF